jgi:hypothetical protein
VTVSPLYGASLSVPVIFSVAPRVAVAGAVSVRAGV